MIIEKATELSKEVSYIINIITMILVLLSMISVIGIFIRTKKSIKNNKEFTENIEKANKVWRDLIIKKNNEHYENLDKCKEFMTDSCIVDGISNIPMIADVNTIKAFIAEYCKRNGMANPFDDRKRDLIINKNILKELKNIYPEIKDEKVLEKIKERMFNLKIIIKEIEGENNGSN